jgi:Inorganic pyrophosphatase
MSKKNGTHSALAEPSRLKPFDADDKELLRVVIETPKGSRNEFAFNPDERIFELKKVLPAGMTFPYDFRFAPSTKADDGDPVDVLVLMDEPAFPGCVLSCVPIGVIEGEQEKKARSMIAGALTFTAYALCVSWCIMHFKIKTLYVTLFALPLWFGVAFTLWQGCLR